MPILLRNAVALLAGVVAGSLVNMALVAAGPSLIPPPSGVDMTSTEGLRSGMHLLQPRHFVMPFLAHALGAFSGALVAWSIASRYRAHMAYAVGCFFLLGGVVASIMIPAPAWFIALDLIAAYLPMAWLATRVGGTLGRGRQAAALHPA